MLSDQDWVKRLRGCGQYGRDSIAIFCYGSDENASSDTWLNEYVGWRAVEKWGTSWFPALF